MRHMLAPNVALTTSWQAGVIGSIEFDAVMAVERPVDFNFYRRGGEYVFPIYLHYTQVDASRAGIARRQENIAPEFRAFIDARYEHHYTPEEILGYIYAVLHAPAYRTRYAEFLRVDFPRVPFPEGKIAFDTLSALGSALVEAHLLRETPRRGLGQYHGRGDHTVEFVRYSSKDRAISINKAQSFRLIPEDVWNFHIGGYQVLDKYLKSRKGRVLSLDEMNHVGAVADSLAFTIEQMARIDEAYQAVFPDVDKSAARKALQ